MTVWEWEYSVQVTSVASGRLPGTVSLSKKNRLLFMFVCIVFPPNQSLNSQHLLDYSINVRGCMIFLLS